MTGIAKTAKSVYISKFTATRYPANIGATMAPVRPRPAHQPMPVDFISVRYVRAATANIPQKAPFRKTPIMKIKT